MFKAQFTAWFFIYSVTLVILPLQALAINTSGDSSTRLSADSSDSNARVGQADVKNDVDTQNTNPPPPIGAPNDRDVIVNNGTEPVGILNKNTGQVTNASRPDLLNNRPPESE